MQPGGAAVKQQEETPQIPNKLYFRISEVSRLTGVKAYVLRYWETEFPSLSPKKSGTGHRLYRRKDVDLLFEIKRLLYEKRYTIEGARKHLDQANAAKRKDTETPPETETKPQAELIAGASPGALQAIRLELAELVKLLST